MLKIWDAGGYPIFSEIPFFKDYYYYYSSFTFCFFFVIFFYFFLLILYVFCTWMALYAGLFFLYGFCFFLPFFFLGRKDCFLEPLDCEDAKTRFFVMGGVEVN
jgi:hypothetical protein